MATIKTEEERERIAMMLQQKYGTPASMPAPDVPHYSEDPTDPVFFYGGPFSNFVSNNAIFVRTVQPFGEIARWYNTVEEFYQACKAKDKRQHEIVADAGNPGTAKVFGNAVDLREDWEEVKYDLMLIGLREKFKDPYMTRELLSTGERWIAEDSPTDFIWGIRDELGGFTGQNLLGLALMQVRDAIREEMAANPQEWRTFDAN